MTDPAWLLAHRHSIPPVSTYYLVVLTPIAEERGTGRQKVTNNKTSYAGAEMPLPTGWGFHFTRWAYQKSACRTASDSHGRVGNSYSRTPSGPECHWSDLSWTASLVGCRGSDHVIGWAVVNDEIPLFLFLFTFIFDFYFIFSLECLIFSLLRQQSAADWEYDTMHKDETLAWVISRRPFGARLT